jgi:glycine/D-amino acid oxidase-like deaminating enzyme
VNVEASRATLDFFRTQSLEFGFRERGYLWLYADRDLFARALEKRALQSAHGIGVEVLDPVAVRELFPLLDGGA